MIVRVVGGWGVLRTTRLRSLYNATALNSLQIHNNNVGADLFDVFVADVAVVIAT